jgi:hypothetical protein
MSILGKLILFAGLVAFTVASLGISYAAEPAINSEQTQGFRIVQGEVLKMEGNTYLVRDETGKEVRLVVNKDSKVDTAFEVGDKIVAQVSDQGVVTLIKKSSTSKIGEGTGSGPQAPAPGGKPESGQSAP